jgi:CMP-N,N'-diacetyllegionaminic acid synthase
MKKITDTLAIIPARGGSKGLPGKNIKPLNGKPLIWYTIEAAREVFPDNNICVTTDDQAIIDVVEQTGLKVPFIRPAELATDTAGSWEVVEHAYSFYKKQGKEFEKLVLLQPTSPLRTGKNIKEAWELFENTPEAEIVASVKKTKANPYFNLFEADEAGFLHLSKEGNFKTRQECPDVYELNGAIYFLTTEGLEKKLNGVNLPMVPYLMGEWESVDIDEEEDFLIASSISQTKLTTNQ